MTHDLADARLLVVKRYGHNAFLNPSTCAGNDMTTYFRTGAVPRTVTICSQNLTPFAVRWADDEMTLPASGG